MSDDSPKLPRRTPTIPDDFKSPMPVWDDGSGPDYVPVWQPMIAAIAAVGTVTFALLLYQKL